jgi:hypothetical protein
LVALLGVKGVQQMGQRRCGCCRSRSVGMGAHRLPEGLGAGLVGAQPVGRAVDADDDTVVQQPVEHRGGYLTIPCRVCRTSVTGRRAWRHPCVGRLIFPCP